MKCRKCHFEMPENALLCPKCQVEIPAAQEPSTQIGVDQTITDMNGGIVKGVEVGQVKGDVSIQSTVNEIETKIEQGDYVDRRQITNIVLLSGSQSFDEIVRSIAEILIADKRTLQNPRDQSVPENISRQIAEIQAAQKDVASKGLPTSPQALYQLGMLAAYDRKYDEALDYFRQATDVDDDYADAYEAIAWLQQARAHDDIYLKSDPESAVARLKEARKAAMHTDPLDVNALSLRGYIAGTLYQATKHADQSHSEKYNAEAADIFTQAVRLDPSNPSALKGLATAKHEMGDLDAAISLYLKTIELAPEYVSAHHDLAIAYEDKMHVDEEQKTQWCRKALQEWQKAYQLAPNDPGYSADYIVQMIGKRIARLKEQCWEMIQKNVK